MATSLNPFTFGGQIAQSSTNEPERIYADAGARSLVATKTPQPAPIPKMGPADAKIFGFSDTAPSAPPSITARGGPMAYSARGEGTTNANAYRVGGNRGNRAQRLIERAARRGTPGSLQSLAYLEQGAQNRQQRWEELMFGRGQAESEFQRAQEADDRRYDRARLDRQEERLYGREAEEAQFLRTQEAEDRRYDRSRADQIADREAMRGFSVQPLDPADPTKGSAVLRGNGDLFNLLPGEKPREGFTPEEIAAYKALGLQPESIERGGVKLQRTAPPPADVVTEETTTKDATGNTRRIATRRAAPPSTTPQTRTGTRYY